LNDHATRIVLRNILLLSILGKAKDITITADVALHAWYSVFLPPEYHLQVASHAAELVQNHQCNQRLSMKFGERGSMIGQLGQEELMLLAATITSKYTAAAVNTEMHRVRRVVPFLCVPLIDTTF
jgi:hypothetical protein